MTKYEDVPQFGNLKGMKVVVSPCPQPAPSQASSSRKTAPT